MAQLNYSTNTEQSRELPQVSMCEFISTIFSGKAEGAHAWTGTHKTHIPDLLDDLDKHQHEALYISTATFYPAEEGKEEIKPGLERYYPAGKILHRNHLIADVHGVILDDIGTKVQTNDLQPTYKLMSSEGNEQWFYAFDTPQPKVIVDRLLKDMKNLRESIGDPGAMTAARKIRMPAGINGKVKEGVVNDFRCRIIEWSPERTFTLREIHDGWELGNPDKLKSSTRGKLEPVGTVTFTYGDSERQRATYTECPATIGLLGGAKFALRLSVITPAALELFDNALDAIGAVGADQEPVWAVDVGFPLKLMDEDIRTPPEPLLFADGSTHTASHRYAGFDKGKKRWLKFSKLSGKFDAEEAEKKWQNMKPSQTWPGAILTLAEQEYGWENPWKHAVNDDYDTEPTIQEKAEAALSLAKTLTSPDPDEWDRLARLTVQLKTSVQQAITDEVMKGKVKGKAEFQALLKEANAAAKLEARREMLTSGALAGSSLPPVPEKIDSFDSFSDNFIYVKSENAYFNRTSVMFEEPTAFGTGNNSMLRRLPDALKLDKPDKVTAQRIVANRHDGMLVADAMTYYPGVVDALVSRGRALFLNTWRPSDVVATHGADISLWLEHAAYIMPVEAEREHAFDMMAFTVQNPGIKINHGLVIGGPERTGKDTLVMPLRVAVGAHNCADVPNARLDGEYEDYAVSRKLLIFQEIHKGSKRDSKGVENKIKNYLAAPPDEISLRRLGKPDIIQPNLFAVIMFTNHRDALHISSDGDRYFPIWSDKEKRKPEYYRKLYHWLDHEGGTEAVVGFLQDRDVSQFDPKAPPPQTAFKTELRDNSKGLIESQIEEAIAGLVFKGQYIFLKEALDDELRSMLGDEKAPTRLIQSIIATMPVSFKSTVNIPAAFIPRQVMAANLDTKHRVQRSVYFSIEGKHQINNELIKLALCPNNHLREYARSRIQPQVLGGITDPIARQLLTDLAAMKDVAPAYKSKQEIEAKKLVKAAVEDALGDAFIQWQKAADEDD